MENIASNLDSLFDIAVEALAQQKEHAQDKVKKFVLPRLALMSKILPAKDEKIPDSIPAIPPKHIKNITTLTDFDYKATWFYIQSPREVYGVVGPFTVPDLITMYKYGDITDDTYLWQKNQLNELGHECWMRLDEIVTLKYKITAPPIIPQKVEETMTKKIKNPLPGALDDNLRNACVPLKDYFINRPCVRCGAVADSYIPKDLLTASNPKKQEKVPDMNLLRDAAGSSNAASEVIPGFLWIGSSLSAKASVFYQMEFSLIICCGTELRNPAPKPPNYRCRKAQLDDNPPEPPDTPGGDNNNNNNDYDLGETSNDFVENIIHVFDQVHDWIETERIYSERSVESDMPIPVYRGATDIYGRPLSKYDNGYPKKTLNERLASGYKILPPTRVLVWSKSGNDRAPSVVVAYLIKRWGISLAAALKVVGKSREYLNICPAYLKILSIYEKRNWVGELICLDCRIDTSSDSNINGYDEYGSGSGSGSGSVNASYSDSRSRSHTLAAATATSESNEDHSNKVDDRNNINNTSKDSGDGGFNKSISYLASKITSMPSFSSCDPELALVLQSSSVLSSLGSTTLYIKPVLPIPDLRASSAYIKKYSNLVDLCLSGRGLGDQGVVELFKALNSSDIISRIRLLELQCNKIGDIGAISIAESFSYSDEKHKKKDHYHSNHLEIISMNLSDNNIGYDGCEALGSMLQYCNSLVSFNISNNRAGDAALAHIISALYVSNEDFVEEDNNNEEDDETVVNTASSQQLLPTALIPRPHNNSIVELKAINNLMGSTCSACIEKLFVSNKTITSLYLDFNLNFTSKDIKNIMRAIKLYNTTLEVLSISDIPLTLKSFESTMKLFSGPKPFLPLRKFMIARCGINSSYMPKLPSMFRLGWNYLKYLDISGNPLEDEGISSLAEALVALGRMAKTQRLEFDEEDDDDDNDNRSSMSGVSDTISSSPLLREGSSISFTPKKTSSLVFDSSTQSTSSKNTLGVMKIKFLPLVYLDVSSCKFGPMGLITLLSNLSNLDTLRVLDLSQNNIGPRPSNVTGSDYVTITNGSEDEASSIATTETKVEAVLHICDLLKRLPLTELKMNRCKLFTKGSMALFKMLSDTGQDTCGHSLKVLQLSGNEIFDSITDSLTMMLKKNTVLQVLDLGFNKFSSLFTTQMQGALEITSSSSLEFKLKNLTIHLAGNDCDQLVLDTPHLGRSKSTMTFRSHQPIKFNNYDHVSINARQSYIERVSYDERAKSHIPNSDFNFIA